MSLFQHDRKPMTLREFLVSIKSDWQDAARKQALSTSVNMLSHRCAFIDGYMRAYRMGAIVSVAGWFFDVAVLGIGTSAIAAVGLISAVLWGFYLLRLNGAFLALDTRLDLDRRLRENVNNAAGELMNAEPANKVYFI